MKSSQELISKMSSDKFYKDNHKNMTKYLLKFWIFLQGKKTTIMAIAGATSIFMLGRGYILQDTAEYIAAMLVALGFGANVANYKSKKK